MVDLRPFASSEVYVAATDFDGDGDQESLQIVTGASAQVIVVGHFSAYSNYTSCCGQEGRIESLVFSDGTFGGEGTVGSNSAARTSSEEDSADTVDALISASRDRAENTSEGAELEKAAEKLLKEAKKDAPENPLPQQPSPGEGES